MNGALFIGALIMCSCCFGCAFLFLLIGIHADKSVKPVGFWSGKEVDPHSVSDVDSYNKENARMWKMYSVPYFLSGILSIPGGYHEGFIIASAVVLSLAALLGIPVLISNYRKIEKKYINPKMLDKINPFC